MRIEPGNVLDLLTEDLLSMSEAAKEVPTNPHPSAIYRWCHRGVDGIKLEHIKIGGKLFTTRQSLARFFARRNSQS